MIQRLFSPIVIFLTPFAFGVSTEPASVTPQDITEALVDSDWKWKINLSEGTSSVSVELVEFLPNEKEKKIRSLVGADGSFSVPPSLLNSRNLELLVIKWKAKNSIYLRAGLMTGDYKLPDDFTWPNLQICYPNKWKEGLLLLCKDFNTERYIALRIIEK
jgi:hypothetical protein